MNVGVQSDASIVKSVVLVKRTMNNDEFDVVQLPAYCCLT